MSAPSTEIDVFSSDVYTGGIPHEAFAWMRAQPGMVRQAIPDPQLDAATTSVGHGGGPPTAATC
jgi:hypothetical protein